MDSLSDPWLEAYHAVRATAAVVAEDCLPHGPWLPPTAERGGLAWEALRAVPDILKTGGRAVANAAVSVLPETRAGKAQVALTCGLAAWMFQEKVGFGRVWAAVKLPKLSTLRTMLGGEPRTVMARELPSLTGGGLLESKRDGSNEAAMTVPKCQGLVGTMVDGNFVAHGCCVRVDSFIVLPDHVIAHSDRIWIKGSQSCVEVTSVDRIALDTDLIGLELPESKLSQIGIAKPTLHEPIPVQGLHVSIVGVAGKGTVGVLNHDGRSFGRVVYSGSTLPGYSGAGYMKGAALAGMHQCGGAVNGGYSISYVWVCIKLHKKMQMESAGWLTATYKAGHSIEVDESYRDLDEMRIRVQGRYTTVGREDYLQAFGSYESQRFKKRKPPSYEDEENEEEMECLPGEGNSLKSTSGASGGPSTSEDSETTRLNRLQREYSQLSKKQKKSFQSRVNLCVATTTPSILTPDQTQAPSTV
uniref:Putative replicase n=1 Tax=Frankliniella occidentalis associated sobemo-like virus 1 TaxID=2854218 RepID=A0A8F4SVN2_9VIRU|nr:putative replicase [Frankliniella occidentalis associated sobemo-like virus 1]